MDCRRCDGRDWHRDRETAHWWSTCDNGRSHQREERSRSRDLRRSSRTIARYYCRPDDRTRLDIRAGWASSSATHWEECNPTGDLREWLPVVVLRWSLVFPVDRGDRRSAVEHSDRSPLVLGWIVRSFLWIDANTSAACRHTFWFRPESSHWPTTACSTNEPTRCPHCFRRDRWTKSHRMTRDGTDQWPRHRHRPRPQLVRATGTNASLITRRGSGHHCTTTRAVETLRARTWWSSEEHRSENCCRDRLHECPSRSRPWRSSREEGRSSADDWWGDYPDCAMKDYWPEKWDQNRRSRYQVRDSLRRTALSNNGKRHDSEQYWKGHPRNTTLTPSPSSNTLTLTPSPSPSSHTLTLTPSHPHPHPQATPSPSPSCQAMLGRSHSVLGEARGFDSTLWDLPNIAWHALGSSSIA